MNQLPKDPSAMEELVKSSIWPREVDTKDEINNEHLALLATGQLDLLTPEEQEAILRQVASRPDLAQEVADLRGLGLGSAKVSNLRPQGRLFPRMVRWGALAACLLVVIGSAVWRFGGGVPTAAMQTAAKRSPEQMEATIFVAIKELHQTPKLMVLTATVDAEIHKSSATTWLYVYWGTTTVDVRARENKVQFYVPLQDISTTDFRYDKASRVLIVQVPEPVLDEDLVKVQTNPDKIEQRTADGWAKLGHFSGAPMREEARRELRRAVLEAARQPAQYGQLNAQAKANAAEHLKMLLSHLVGELQPKVRLEVKFKASKVDL